MINFDITYIRRVFYRSRTNRGIIKKFFSGWIVVYFGNDNIGQWFCLIDGAWASPGVLQRRDFLANWKALA